MDRRVGVAAVGALALLLSGCGGGGPQASGDSKLSGDRIVLGVLNDQSGVYLALSGTNSVKAVEMAIADFKAKHGGGAITDDITVETADHQNKPDVANTKAAEMYDRLGVDAILDVPTSSAALKVADVAKEKKKLYFNISGATTDLTGKSCNKYTFHYAYDTYMLANGTGKTVTEQGAKNWYIVYPNYAFGQDMEKSFSTATSSDRSPSALSMCRRTSSSLSPGIVRMSTSMSTTSGMTLVFTPARHMFGEKVVWVADHAYFAMPGASRAMPSSILDGSTSAAFTAGSRSSWVTKPRRRSST